MGGRNCCVKNCRRRSHDHRGRKILNGLTFHCFPSWRRNEGGQISELTRRRRAAWVAAVGRSNITFNCIPSSMRVCSRHFHSGKPAYEMLESDPDWVPSLHLGHSDTRRAERLPLSVQSETDRKQGRTTETRPSDVSKKTWRESEEAAGGGGRPVVRPWSEVRSLLQSALQRKTNIGKQPGDETNNPPPAVKETDLSFRDFFREALQASLEASSRSRAQSQRPPSVSGEKEAEVVALEEQNQTREESSSSSCLNCDKLQRRIEELEEKLFDPTGQREEDTQTIPANQVLQSPEQVHTEEEQAEWMEPLSPPQVDLHEDNQDVDLAKSSSKRRRCRSLRFRKDWLNMFWFLRYSPALDQMWCHVCRLHADRVYRDLALIKGSRMFKVHNIRKHSDSNYHKDNVQRYMQHKCDVQL